MSTPAAAGPVWVKNEGKEKVFYVRSANTTQPLDSEEAHRYIMSHWRQ
jgi:hypothetical protein